MIELLNLNESLDSRTDIEERINAASQASRDFFGRDLKTPIKIKLLYTRAEMDEVMKQKTADWVVGYANNNQISIFSPSVFESVAKRPKEDFDEILTHEIAHLFLDQLHGKNFPIWFKEGIAGYVAKQYEQYQDKDLSKITWEDLNPDNWSEKPNYPAAFLFTKFLIEKYGKEKVFRSVNFQEAFYSWTTQ